MRKQAPAPMNQAQIEGGARGAPTRAVAGGGPRPGGLWSIPIDRTQPEHAGSTGRGVRTIAGSARLTLRGQSARSTARCFCGGRPSSPRSWFPSQKMLAASSVAISALAESSGSTIAPSANWLMSAITAVRKLGSPKKCLERRAIGCSCSIDARDGKSAADLRARPTDMLGVAGSNETP